MTGSFLESAGSLLAILTPLVAVPLTVITFYLRTLREHQLSIHADLVRRVESIETATERLRKALGDFERDYTTKEEWLRECMLARRTLQQLMESSVRLDATVQSLLPAARAVDYADRASAAPHEATSDRTQGIEPASVHAGEGTG